MSTKRPVDAGQATATPPAEKVTFEHGTDRVTALRTRPDLTDEVAARRAELQQADRTHAIGLAMIRRAADLTQAELAEVLGVGQAAVAKMERRPDLLLSTLRAYLQGLGGHARLIVEFDDGDRQIELDLDTLGLPEQRGHTSITATDE